LELIIICDAEPLRAPAREKWETQLLLLPFAVKIQSNNPQQQSALHDFSN